MEKIFFFLHEFYTAEKCVLPNIQNEEKKVKAHNSQADVEFTKM